MSASKKNKLEKLMKREERQRKIVLEANRFDDNLVEYKYNLPAGIIESWRKKFRDEELSNLIPIEKIAEDNQESDNEVFGDIVITITLDKQTRKIGTVVKTTSETLDALEVLGLMESTKLNFNKENFLRHGK